MTRPAAILAAAALAIAGASPAAAQFDVPVVQAFPDPVFGLYLVGTQGTAVYAFTADTQGAGTSACDATCRQTWQPFTTDMEISAGEGADGALVGMFPIEAGRFHITYNGWPLYLYVRDEASGDRRGRNREEFGGFWRMLDVAGALIVPAP